MAKNKNVWIIVAIAAIIIIAVVLPKLDLFVIGSPGLTRTAPTTVNPGQTFAVTYATQGAPASKWFVAWDDTITGGCTPANYRNFMALETGGDKTDTMTFTAPSSGSCTFTGFYQYTGQLQFPLTTITVNVCQPATCASLGYNCGAWDNGCGTTLNCGTVGTGQQCQSGHLVTCSTVADTNCDGLVTMSELTTYAGLWISGSATFNDLITAANAWVNS